MGCGSSKLTGHRIPVDKKYNPEKSKCYYTSTKEWEKKHNDMKLMANEYNNYRHNLRKSLRKQKNLKRNDRSYSDSSDSSVSSDDSFFKARLPNHLKHNLKRMKKLECKNMSRNDKNVNKRYPRLSK